LDGDSNGGIFDKSERYEQAIMGLKDSGDGDMLYNLDVGQGAIVEF
jgi:hypothetical protein